MRRLIIGLLAVSLFINGFLVFQLNRRHAELVRKEQGFLVMALGDLAIHVNEVRYERQPCAGEIVRLANRLHHTMGSKDIDTSRFYTYFFAAWSGAYSNAITVLHADHEWMTISLVIYENLIPLVSSARGAKTLNQKNKRLVALSLAEQLKERDLWNVLTSYRPELDELFEQIQ